MLNLAVPMVGELGKFFEAGLAVVVISSAHDKGSLECTKTIYKAAYFTTRVPRKPS